MAAPPYSVIHVLNTLEMGGTQRFVLALATAKDARFVHSVLCLSRVSGGMAENFIKAGVSVRFLPQRWPPASTLRPYRLWRWISDRLSGLFGLRLMRMLGAVDADVVHTHIITRVDLIADAVVNRAKLPMVWTLHSTHHLSREMLAKCQTAVTLLRLHGGRVTAVSSALARHCAIEGICPESGIDVAPGGVDLDQFSPDAARDPSWRQTHSIPSRAILFGCAGRIEPIKGFDTLVSALAITEGRGQDAHVAIAGEDTHAAFLRIKINKLGLGDRVHLVGAKLDMAAFYRELDVFVMPSLQEGFGLALVEALACGIPCISSCVGVAPDALGAGAGLLVPPGSADDLAGAMIQMIAPETRAFHAAAASKAAKPYSLPAMVQRYCGIYASLLR